MKFNKRLYNVRHETYLSTLLFLFFLQIACCFYSYTRIALILEIVLICAVPVCALIFRHAEYEVKIQMLGLNFWGACIWIAAIFCKVTVKDNLLLIFTGLICLLSGCIINFCFLIQHFTGSHIIAGLLRKNVCVLVICIVYFLLSFCVIYDAPTYDSGVYYAWSVANLAPNFNFTLENILSYCLAQHISVGYGVLILFGELISPFTSSGVHLVNIILAIISIVAFYKTMELLFPHYSSLILGLASAIYAFSPYMLGMAGIINLDNPGVYLLIIMIYCYVKKYEVWEIFFSWVFVCTKEPHVIYYTFFVLGSALLDIINRKKDVEKKLFVYKMIKENFYKYFLVVFWFLYYIAPGRNSWVSSKYLFNNNSVHTIGFTVENFVIKLKELLILNFNWIFIMAVIFCVIYKCKIYKTMPANLNIVVFPTLFCLIGVLLFNLFYIDFPHPRYIAVGAECVVLLGILSLLVIKKADQIGVLYLSIIMLLMLGQSFFTMDPLTRMSFTSMDYSDTGAGLVTMSGGRFNDSAIYNREYLYYNKAFEAVLREIDYKDSDILVFPEYENIPRSYMYENRFLWNLNEKKIQTKESDCTIPILIASSEEELMNFERVIYLEPYCFPEDKAVLSGKQIAQTLDVRYRTMVFSAKIVKSK